MYTGLLLKEVLPVPATLQLGGRNATATARKYFLTKVSETPSRHQAYGSYAITLLHYAKKTIVCGKPREARKTKTVTHAVVLKLQL